MTIYSFDILLFLFGTRKTFMYIWFNSSTLIAWRFSCSMSSSNCCFLTCIQVSQEPGQVVWYSDLLKSFPQFVVIYTVKGFGMVNKVERDFFWNFFAFSMIQQMLAIWSLVPLPFLNPACTSGSSQFTYCWRLDGKILSISLLACDISAIVR